MLRRVCWLLFPGAFAWRECGWQSVHVGDDSKPEEIVLVSYSHCGGLLRLVVVEKGGASSAHESIGHWDSLLRNSYALERSKGPLKTYSYRRAYAFVPGSHNLHCASIQKLMRVGEFESGAMMRKRQNPGPNAKTTRTSLLFASKIKTSSMSFFVVRTGFSPASHRDEDEAPSHCLEMETQVVPRHGGGVCQTPPSVCRGVRGQVSRRRFSGPVLRLGHAQGEVGRRESVRDGTAFTASRRQCRNRMDFL